MQRIVSFDPGETTGVCVLETTDCNTDFVVKEVCEIPWDERFRLIEAFVTGTLPYQGSPHSPEFVTVERFRLRAHQAMSQTGSEFPSSQILGIIETFIYINPGPEIIYQEPIQMSRVQIRPDDHYLLVGSEHMKDAYRHARFFFITKLRKVTQ